MTKIMMLFYKVSPCHSLAVYTTLIILERLQ